MQKVAWVIGGQWKNRRGMEVKLVVFTHQGLGKSKACLSHTFDGSFVSYEGQYLIFLF